jgi:hypothetical protein
MSAKHCPRSCDRLWAILASVLELDQSACPLPLRLSEPQWPIGKHPGTTGNPRPLLTQNTRTSCSTSAWGQKPSLRSASLAPLCPRKGIFQTRQDRSIGAYGLWSSTFRPYPALTAALRAARRVNLFAGRVPGDNRQKSGAVAGRAYLFDHVRLYWLHYACGSGDELPERLITLFQNSAINCAK